MGIFGAAKRGFGLLKKSKKAKGIDPKKRLETFKKASQKADRDQTIKKAKRLIKESKAAIQRRLMTPAPLTPIPKGKKWVGRINPDGSHVRPKKSIGGVVSKLKKLNKLKGVHGGKGMVALGAGAVGVGLAARSQIKKFEKDVEKAGGLDAYYDKTRNWGPAGSDVEKSIKPKKLKKRGTGPAGGPKKSIKPKKK